MTQEELSKLSAEEKRAKIAVACGCKWIGHPDQVAATKGFSMPEKWVLDPQGNRQFPCRAPEYLNSLDAIHEAEEHIPDDKEHDYLELLGYCNENNTSEIFMCVHATAAQRSDAFLLSI